MKKGDKVRYVGSNATGSIPRQCRTKSGIYTIDEVSPAAMVEGEPEHLILLKEGQLVLASELRLVKQE